MLDAFLITGWLALTAPVTVPGDDVAFCIRVDPDGYNLLHSQPCRRDDIGWTDARQAFHVFGWITQLQLQRALTQRLIEEWGDPKLGDCVLLPPGDRPWTHAPPCIASDIGVVANEDYIVFNPSVTNRQLEYGIALTLFAFNSLPIAVWNYPEYGGEKPDWMRREQ